MADQNAFGEDFPVEALGPWIAPNQHNIVLHNGEPHHVIIIPDKDTEFVNPAGNSSIRGGAIAQKVYNPQAPTRDRLKSPMVRMFGVLMPVPWDFRPRYRRGGRQPRARKARRQRLRREDLLLWLHGEHLRHHQVRAAQRQHGQLHLSTTRPRT